MHELSYNKMKRLADTYLGGRTPGTVYDLGSLSIGGSYRPIFAELGWQYRGIDIEAGPNVDIVLADPYVLPLADASSELVISGQAFEHIEFFWLTFKEMARVLAPGGLIFLIAPSRGHEHRYPVDCWRFYPDGYRALAKWGGLDMVEVSTRWNRRFGPWYARERDMWGDTAGVFRKPSNAADG